MADGFLAMRHAGSNAAATVRYPTSCLRCKALFDIPDRSSRLIAAKSSTWLPAAISRSSLWRLLGTPMSAGAAECGKEVFVKFEPDSVRGLAVGPCHPRGIAQGAIESHAKAFVVAIEPRQAAH